MQDRFVYCRLRISLRCLFWFDESYGRFGSQTKIPCLSINYLGLARLISGTEKDTVPWPREETLEEALNLLCERYGKEFRSTVFTMSGTLQNYIKIELDDVDINELQGLKTVLNGSQKVKFIVTVPSLAGG